MDLPTLYHGKRRELIKFYLSLRICRQLMVNGGVKDSLLSDPATGKAHILLKTNVQFMLMLATVMKFIGIHTHTNNTHLHT